MTDIRYEQAVRALVERFLTAAGDGDLDALPAKFASKANIGIASRRDGRWVTSTQTFEEWFTAIKARPSHTRFEERSRTSRSTSRTDNWRSSGPMPLSS